MKMRMRMRMKMKMKMKLYGKIRGSAYSDASI